MGTAVTAGQHFPTRLKAIRQQDSGTLDSMDIGFVLQKVSQRFRGFVQFVTNKIWYMRIILQYEWNNPGSVPDSRRSEKQQAALSLALLILCAAFAYNNVSKVVIIL